MSHNNNKFLLVFCALCMMVSSPLAAAQDTEVPPGQVYIGVYVNQIYDISLRDNKFSVDFYIWFRWKSDSIDPLESFEVVNGRVESIDGLYEDIIKGYNYASCRVVATITKFWDVTDFPLDDHILTIEIEDTDNENFKLQYIADSANCAMNPEIQIPGWRVDRGWGKVIDHRYQTNYGDISLPTNSQSFYSRFVYSISAKRPGLGYFAKLFFGVMIAALIAFLAFFIKPIDLDPRFGLGIGAIFAAVASEYVITSALPDTNVMTLADKLHILAFIFIFLSLAQSTLSLKWYGDGKEKRARRFDIACFYLFTLVYLLISVVFILTR
jgi:hypothetical protein